MQLYRLNVDTSVRGKTVIDVIFRSGRPVVLQRSSTSEMLTIFDKLKKLSFARSDIQTEMSL